jgi:hypothetical protein
METIGKIYKISETQEITEKFKKREFVLEVSNNPAYVEKVIFQLTQDKTDLIDSYSEGDEVKVQFNLKGKEWSSPSGEVKYFNTLEAWKIEKQSSDNKPNQTPENLSTRAEVSSDSDDDLPF